MKVLKYHVVIILVVIGLISCGSDNDEVTPKVRTADDVRTDFQNLTIKSGINDLVLESIVEGVFWNFRLIVPEAASELNKRPLILSLHGGASNIFPEAHKSTACLVVPGFIDLNAFIISPNSNGDFWYDQPNQIQVLALLDLVQSNFSIDRGKVLATGYSDGGNGSWFYAQYYPELISAAIPMASSYNTAGTDGVVSKITIPLYVIHGENDELFPLAQTQEWVEMSVDAGSSIEFVIATGLTHNQFCDYVGYLSDAVDWLQYEVWNE